MAAKRWPALATGGSDTFGIDWTRRLPAGSSLVSVAYTSDPVDSNISFSGEEVASNVGTVIITADSDAPDKSEYLIKCVPTLDTGVCSPVSVLLKIVKHKPAE